MPIGAGAGALLGGGLMAAGSVGSSLIGASAAKSAANTQSDAIQRAIEYQQGNLPAATSAIWDSAVNAQNRVNEYFPEARQVAAAGANTAINGLRPWYNTGVSANNTLASLYGFNGSDPQRSALSNFSSTPNYQFAFDQGMQGLNRSTAAQGLSLSGAALKDSMSFGQGLASQQFNNYVSQLGSLSNTGLTAGSTMGGYALGAGMNDAGLLTQQGNALANYSYMPGQAVSNAILGVGNNVSSSLTNQGAANAAGIVGAGNAYSGGINSAMQNGLLGYAMFKPGGIFGSGGNQSSTIPSTNSAYGGPGNWNLGSYGGGNNAAFANAAPAPNNWTLPTG